MKNIILFSALSLAAACGGSALVSNDQTDYSLPNDAGTADAAHRDASHGVDSGDAGCVLPEGNVTTDQIDAMACMHDGGTCGNIVCYTLAATCAFCCVCQE